MVTSLTTSTQTATQELNRQVIATWLHHDNAWLDSATLSTIFPTLDKQRIYARVSELSSIGVLKKRPRSAGTGYEYQLANPEDFRASAPVTPKQIPEGVKGKKTKVFWKPVEQIAIAEEVARLRALYPSYSLSHLVNMAQGNPKVLPPHRRRARIHSTQDSVPWLEGLMTSLPSKVVEEARAHEAAEAAVVHATPVEIPVPTPSELTTDALWAELAKRVSSVLAQVVVQVLTAPEVVQLLNRVLPAGPAPKQATNQVTEHVRRHNPQGIPITPDKPKLEKLLIVGRLKPNHITEVKAEFSEAYDLRFHLPDQSNAMLKAMAQGADRVIVMTDIIAHSQEDTLRAVHVQYTRLAGSVSKLKELLTHLYANS